MSDLTCKNCGGDMAGDGYTVQVHCESVDLIGHPKACAPDAAPIYCEPKEWTSELAVSLRRVHHQPKKKCYQITLEVEEGIGARIMDYAAMVGGLRPWDVSKLLDGGLRLTERGDG